MKKKNVTIHDIANNLNISASTVSRALHDHPAISIPMKEAVKKMARKLNYQPNSLAVGLRKGKSNIIGIVIPRINRNFFSNVIDGIENIARNAGYNIIITQSNEIYLREVENIKSLLNARVDGILISLSAGTKKYHHLEQVKQRGIPLICFDRISKSINTSSVILDDFTGAYDATKHLIKQGCKDIIHFAGPDHINIYQNRKKGYIEALNISNLPVKEEYIIPNILTIKDGYRAAKELFCNKKKPDALFSASDFSALGAVNFFREKKIKIPDEVAICGFSNEPFMALHNPTLSSVEQHSNEIGTNVAKLFLEEIEMKTESRVPKQILIKPELIIRQSSSKNNSHSSYTKNEK